MTKRDKQKDRERQREGQGDTRGHKGDRWGHAKKTERDKGRDRQKK